MNVLRSMARDLMQFATRTEGAATSGATTSAPSRLSQVRDRPIAPVVGFDRFHDSFDKFPQGAKSALRTVSAERAFQPTFSRASLQRDGFDAAPRRPVDLSGGVKSTQAANTSDALTDVAAGQSNAFSASLDDLASLL